MTPEEIAGYDHKIKQADPRLLLEIDRLFFALSDKKAAGKLKGAAQSLLKTKAIMDETEWAIWEKALKTQVRSAVDRAKKSAS